MTGWGRGRGKGICLENTVTPKNKIHLCINWLKACREVENTCHWSRKILLCGFYSPGESGEAIWTLE